jgi:hypothetical protein
MLKSGDIITTRYKSTDLFLFITYDNHCMAYCYDFKTKRIICAHKRVLCGYVSI